MKVRLTVKQKAESVKIHTEYIKLQDFLKFADILPSGGMAKNLVQDGLVLVNGEVCTMRGKKLRTGDTVTFEGKTWQVAADES